MLFSLRSLLGHLSNLVDSSVSPEYGTNPTSLHPFRCDPWNIYPGLTWLTLDNNAMLYFFSMCSKPTPCYPIHTSNLSREPRIYPCKFFLAGVNFYRFNAKNWHFRQILREKVVFFTDLTRKIGVFRCKFYSPKILPV